MADYVPEDERADPTIPTYGFSSGSFTTTVSAAPDPYGGFSIILNGIDPHGAGSRVPSSIQREEPNVITLGQFRATGVIVDPKPGKIMLPVILDRNLGPAENAGVYDVVVTQPSRIRVSPGSRIEIICASLPAEDT